MLSEANLFHSPRYFEQISPAGAGILSVSRGRQSFRINKIYQAGVEERGRALLHVEIRSALRGRGQYKPLGGGGVQGQGKGQRLMTTFGQKSKSKSKSVIQQ